MINLKHKSKIFIGVLLFGIVLSIANSIITSLISQNNYVDNVLDKSKAKTLEREKIILDFLDSYQLFAESLKNSVVFNQGSVVVKCC